MDLSLSEAQQILKTSAREFLERECPKTMVKDMARDERGYRPELWTKLAGLGWMGLAFPESYGGMGGDLLDLVVLLEEMGRACLPGPFFATVVLGGLTLLEAGSEGQKRHYLPQLISGERIFTLALTEPSARYTADGISLRAIASANGYVITGTKLFVPDAHIADYIICVARTREDNRPEDGITLFMVEGKGQGLTCTLLRTMAGDKQCEVVFDEVGIPRESIVGGVNQGWSYIEAVLRRATIAKCAEMVGGAQVVLEMTVGYVKDRVQYDRPIGGFQAIQHRCADMVISVEGCRYITYQAASMLSQGLSCAREVAMAKAWVSRTYRRLTALAVQTHGAIGFVEDHDMPLYFKRAKAGELAFGNADFHLEIVARELGFTP